jgi:CRISPR-associated exonuclease Cas4
MNHDKFWITVNDIKQYIYCPRIPFYNNLLSGTGDVTYGMLTGREFEFSLNKNTLTKLFEDLIYDGYKLVKDLTLFSAESMLRGKLDYALIGEHKAYPIEVKYSNNPGIYKMQLAAYSILLEDSLKLKSTEGYFLYKYSHIKIKLNRVKITGSDKAKVIYIADMARSNIMAGIRPDPIGSRAKCNFCEFRNFCDDIF